MLAWDQFIGSDNVGRAPTERKPARVPAPRVVPREPKSLLQANITIHHRSQITEKRLKRSFFAPKKVWMPPQPFRKRAKGKRHGTRNTKRETKWKKAFARFTEGPNGVRERMVTGGRPKQTFLPTQVFKGPHLRNPTTNTGHTSALCWWWHPITATPTNVGPRYNFTGRDPISWGCFVERLTVVLYSALLIQHSVGCTDFPDRTAKLYGPRALGPCWEGRGVWGSTRGRWDPQHSSMI